MKKILLSAVALLSLTAINAQDRQVGTSTVISDRIEMNSDRSDDTLVTPEFATLCNGASSYTIYGSQGAGYVSGTNDYDDKAKGMGYTLGASSLAQLDVVGVFVWYGVKKQGNGNSQFTAHVYDQSKTIIGSPSMPHTVADIDTTAATAGWLEYTFPTPITVTTDSFYVFVDVNDPVNNGTDTVGIVGTQDPCGTSSYEIWNDDSFHHLPSEWGIDIDLGILPLISNLAFTGLFDQEVENFGVYTNANTLYLTGISEDTYINQVNVYDLSGKVVKTFNIADQFDSYNFNISDLKNGNYVVALNTNKGNVAQKINITK